MYISPASNMAIYSHQKMSGFGVLPYRKGTGAMLLGSTMGSPKQRMADEPPGRSLKQQKKRFS